MKSLLIITCLACCIFSNFACGRTAKEERQRREETDRHPLDVCPECMAKICWAMSYDPRQRYERLAAFCREQRLEQEERFFDESARWLN